MVADNIPNYFQLTTPRFSFLNQFLIVFFSMHCSPESVSPSETFQHAIINFSITFVLICEYCLYLKFIFNMKTQEDAPRLIQ
jgi:hypothetical protein